MGASGMKRLVRCGKCHRQYNATGYKPGTRFRCHCGVVVAVPGEAKGLESDVIRCSSCGATRAAKSEFCGFCKSDFTLHEKDMHTICPVCATRISDKAKYCHKCGEPIIPEGSIGEDTDLPCPVCEGPRSLRSRKLAKGLSMMECGRCAGIWLSHRVFDTLKQTAEKGTHPERIGRSKAPGEKSGRQSGPYYRKCPRCRELMHRENFAGISSVIIDACSKHGLWFDDEELSSILRWIQGGGLQEARTAPIITPTLPGGLGKPGPGEGLLSTALRKILLTKF